MSKVSKTDHRPPYVQIADHIRQRIDAGDLAPGEQLASGRDLAEEYGVAAMTVQHAIRLLRAEGRLSSWQGRGVFVAQPGQGDQQSAAESVDADLAARVDNLTRELKDLRARVAALEKR